jgi:hypothetical protein
MLLQGRTCEQIKSAAIAADWLIDESIAVARESYITHLAELGGWELAYLPANVPATESNIRDLLDNWPSDADGGRPGVPDTENTRDLDALREIIGSYDVDADPSFPDGHEYEYYAVLALWKIADVIDWSRGPSGERVLDVPISAVEVELPRIARHIAPETRYVLAGNAALEAMDAIGVAELVRVTEQHVGPAGDKMAEEVARLAKHQRSLAASRAAIQRHADNRAMRAEAIAYYQSNASQFETLADAARAIEKLVAAEHRTIVGWIRPFRQNPSAA